MKRFLLVLLVFTLVIGVAAWAGTGKDKKDKPATSAKASANETTVTGFIVDEKCGAQGASAEKAACAKKCIEGGQKAVLVNDADSSVWMIENQDSIKGHEGHHVTVTGHTDADKKSIHIASLKMAPETPKAQ
ncbi:MAG TPA: hypothetical protein VLA96_07770 [Terriglobales bacterium]|nr:hypothetical protein [Terriglobales bacterium]